MVDLKEKCPTIPVSNLNALAIMQLKAERFESEFIKEQ
jgi:hypothetical protein